MEKAYRGDYSFRGEVEYRSAPVGSSKAFTELTKAEIRKRVERSLSELSSKADKQFLKEKGKKQVDELMTSWLDVSI